MFPRFSRAIAAGRRAAAAAEAARAVAATDLPPDAGPEVGPVGWALLRLGEVAGPDPRLDAHRAFCRARGYRCLLLSNSIPAAFVGARDVVFEHVPWPPQGDTPPAGGFQAGVDYAFRRLGLALAFWQVVGCDCDGAEAAGLLELVPADAHPALISARAAAVHKERALLESGRPC